MQLPALALPYFDPHTLRLEQLRLAAADIEVTDPFWQAAKGIGTFLLAVLASGIALYGARKGWERRRARQTALARVAQADTPAQLAHAVCAFSLSPRPRTLRQWLARWPDEQGLQPLLEELEENCFGSPAPHDFARLKQRWLAALKRSPLA